jgi:hypothetical protein
MSVYASFPLPLVAYGILHRPRPGVPRREYRETITAMHAAVEAESALFNEGEAKLNADLSARQSQMLRGALSQFLETPIRGDNAELQRIFREAFHEHRTQISPDGPSGAMLSWAGAAAPASSGFPAWLKKLESNGRSVRRALGVESPGGSSEVCESVYVVRGGANLDVLEHIVRDRLGIYDSAHGKHIGESAPFVVAVHNLVHGSIAEFGKSLPSAWGEAVITFEKPAVPYDKFRASLTALLDGALPASGVRSATLWQRKLGLGRGAEFALRVLISRHGDLVPLLEGLRSADDPVIAKGTFGKEAGLFVKELFHPRPS